MRILLVGAGGVGSALARIAARRPFAELVVADYDLARAQRAAAARALMNAADPRFVMPLFRAALQAGKLALAGMGAEPGR